MVPTLSFVGDTFRRYNAMIFNEALPLPRFTLTRARTFQGKLCYRRRASLKGMVCEDFEMRISTLFDQSAEEWEDVVIHEMIHLHIAHSGIRDTSAHGPAFISKMNEINLRHGRHITVSGHATESQRSADKVVRAHYLCVARLSDGRYGVAPVAKTRIFQLWDMLSLVPGVIALRWVGSTDAWFNRFPRVQTPKLYIASKEDILAHLKGAVPLERTGSVIKAVSRRCYPAELLP